MDIQAKDPRRPAVDPEAVLANPKFQKLVRARSTLGWVMSAIMVFVYLGLIALVAFDKPLVAQPIGDGPTSVGIALGIAVIISAWVLVGIYVVKMCRATAVADGARGGEVRYLSEIDTAPGGICRRVKRNRSTDTTLGLSAVC